MSIAGVERDVHVLVVSFPFSNMRSAVALPGVVFDPVRWEMRHTDDTGIVTVDGVRYPVGAR